ncbi:MAG TPA: hypothetical protein V6D27_06255 [Vampirovibrionales bacterium]
MTTIPYKVAIACLKEFSILKEKTQTALPGPPIRKLPGFRWSSTDAATLPLSDR